MRGVSILSMWWCRRPSTEGRLQSGGSTINLFSSLLCESSWSPKHWDLQCTVCWVCPWILPLTAWPPELHSSLIPSACGPAPRCPQKQFCSLNRWWLQTWDLHNLCSPRKQTCICRSHSQCINSDRATCVFHKSKTPVEVVQGHRALQWCFPAFCRLPACVEERGNDFY